MKRNTIACLLAATVAGFGAAASADEGQTVLRAVSSPVMINQGERYVPAEEGMIVLPGDQIMAMQGGAAQVQYANGCVHAMASNEVYRVVNEDACSMPADAAVNQAAATPPPGGGGGGAGLLGPLFAAAVGIGIMVEATDSDSADRPSISPE